MPRAPLAVAAVLMLHAARGHAQAPGADGPIADVRTPEVFATVGYLQLGSDEGGIGHGPSYGGGVTLPFWRALALTMDLQSAVVTKPTPFGGSGEYQTRRTLIVPSVVYRFGTRSHHGFVGGGVGAEVERSRYRQTGRRQSGQPWREVAPGVFVLEQSDSGRTLSARAGYAGFSTRQVGVRAEVFVASWHLGAGISFAYRFN